MSSLKKVYSEDSLNNKSTKKSKREKRRPITDSDSDDDISESAARAQVLAPPPRHFEVAGTSNVNMAANSATLPGIDEEESGANFGSYTAGNYILDPTGNNGNMMIGSASGNKFNTFNPVKTVETGNNINETLLDKINLIVERMGGNENYVSGSSNTPTMDILLFTFTGIFLIFAMDTIASMSR